MSFIDHDQGAMPEAMQVIDRSISDGVAAFQSLGTQAAELATEMAHFQHEIYNVTNIAMGEKAATDNENAR
jgi:hypothetical protein